MRIVLVLALLFVARVRTAPAALEAVVGMAGDILARKFREHLQDLLKRPCNCQLVMTLPGKLPWYHHKKGKRHHHRRAHRKRRKHPKVDEQQDSQQEDGNPRKPLSSLSPEQIQQLSQLPPAQQMQALQQMQAQQRPLPSRGDANEDGGD